MSDDPRRSIRLRVEDWPNIRRTASLSLDPTLVRTESDLLEYCRKRFGEGTLREADDGGYEYRRSLSIPAEIKKFVGFLLNKSY